MVNESGHGLERMKYITAFLFVSVIGFCQQVWAAKQASDQARSNWRLDRIPNFGVVDEHLFRGGQPDEAGFDRLKKSGVDIVVSFRHEKGQVAREKQIVERMGMTFVNIPWRGYFAPSDAKVEQFLQIVNNALNQRIFAHCRRGAERTGLMVACYRIGSGWDADEAYQEMRKYRFRSYIYRPLRNYIFRFARNHSLQNADGGKPAPTHELH